MLNKKLMAALSLVLAACGTSATSRMNNLPGEDASAAALLGQGFNTVNGTIKGHCVSLGALTTQSGQTTGSTAEYRMLEITSEQSLRENLNVSATASIKNGVLGSVGGSGRFSFVSSVNKNSSSRYVLVHTRVANQLEMATNYDFVEGAKNLLALGREKEFFDQCGNEFVSGRRTGGEFFALFEYEFSSVEEDRQFAAAIKASGAGWKASSNAAQEMSKFNMAAKVQVKVIRFGGSGALPEVENLVDYGRRFTELTQSISGAPVTLELITKDYSGVNPIDLVRNPALVERQQYVINMLAKNRDEAQEALATARYIKSNPTSFDQVPTEELDRAERELSAFINRQGEAAVACFENIWHGCQIPELSFPSIRFPSRKWMPVAGLCPSSYSWSETDGACCRFVATAHCGVEGDNGQCLAYETKREKSCI